MKVYFKLSKHSVNLTIQSQGGLMYSSISIQHAGLIRDALKSDLHMKESKVKHKNESIHLKSYPSISKDKYDSRALLDVVCSMRNHES